MLTSEETRKKIVEKLLKSGGEGFKCPWCFMHFASDAWGIEEDTFGNYPLPGPRIFVITCPRCGYRTNFRAPERKRKVQVLRNGEWTDVQFERLKKGDVFRLFDIKGADLSPEAAKRYGLPPPEEYPVVIDGACEFRAKCDPYYHDGGLRVEHEAVTLVQEKEGEEDEGDNP